MIPTYRRIACFGGLYSNYLALEAAVADAGQRQVEATFCLGDMGAFGHIQIGFFFSCKKTISNASREIMTIRLVTSWMTANADTRISEIIILPKSVIGTPWKTRRPKIADSCASCLPSGASN